MKNPRGYGSISMGHRRHRTATSQKVRAGRTRFGDQLNQMGQMTTLVTRWQGPHARSFARLRTQPRAAPWGVGRRLVDRRRRSWSPAQCALLEPQKLLSLFFPKIFALVSSFTPKCLVIYSLRHVFFKNKIRRVRRCALWATFQGSTTAGLVRECAQPCPVASHRSNPLSWRIAVVLGKRRRSRCV